MAESGVNITRGRASLPAPSLQTERKVIPMKRTWKGRALSLLLSAALLASLAPAAQAAGEEEPEDGGYSISFKPAENALEVNQSRTMEVTVSGGDGKLPDGMTVEWGTGYNGSQANGPVLGVEPDSANPLKATVTEIGRAHV